VARLGSWDVTAFTPTWFDIDLNQNGCWDHDLVPSPVLPPPPPPPPAPRPRPARRRSRVSTGGGGSGSYRPPDWLLNLIQPSEVEKKPSEKIEADYALIHITEGAVVRATAAGIVEAFVDSKGRSSVVLTTDDGTRYWYVDINANTVANGTRVLAGQPIARAKTDAPPIPEITSSPSRVHALPAPDALPSRPAQPVFVETPAPPSRRFVLLIPVAPTPQEWTDVTPPVRPAAPIVRVIIGVGAVAALLAALSLWGRSRRPPRRSRSRRPRR